MTAYHAEIIIEERDDCEPFRSTDDLAKFIYGKLTDGVVVHVPLIIISEAEEVSR